MAATANAGDVQDVDDRDLRAATEAMVCVPVAPGMFEVYSGTKANYVVDVLEGACECDDARFRGGECKHQRRVEMAIGEREIPEGVRIDPTLATRRER